jgi:hypothetical protein
MAQQPSTTTTPSTVLQQKQAEQYEIIEFVSEECEQGRHNECVQKWSGLGLGLLFICTCNCGHTLRKKMIEEYRRRQHNAG